MAGHRELKAVHDMPLLKNEPRPWPAVGRQEWGVAIEIEPGMDEATAVGLLVADAAAHLPPNTRFEIRNRFDAAENPPSDVRPGLAWYRCGQRHYKMDAEKDWSGPGKYVTSAPKADPDVAQTQG